jgi:drug/metabolite transporter (DMT)-like permease
MDSGGDPRRVTAALVTTLLLWSSAFVAIRSATPHFSTPGMTLARLLIAAITLAALAPLVGLRRPARTDVRRLVACGLTGMVGYQFLLNAGERTIDASTANILVNTSPVLATVLAWILLAQRPHANNWIGLGLGLTGATAIAVTHRATPAASLDAVLILGAAAAQALFFVLQRPLLDRYTGFEVTTYATWIGALVALPAAGELAGDLTSSAQPAALASIVFLGVGPSAVGFLTWAYAQRRVSVAAATSTLYLAPPITAVLGWIMLAETPGPATVLGGLLVISGVVISHRKPATTG